MAVGMSMTIPSQNVLAGTESLLVLEGNQGKISCPQPRDRIINKYLKVYCLLTHFFIDSFIHQVFIKSTCLLLLRGYSSKQRDHDPCYCEVYILMG